MSEFHGGCFRTAIKAQAPVVPVVLVDFWKTFGRNSLKKVHTELYFLEPITYAEYEKMNTQTLSRMVQERIAQKLKEITGQDTMPPASQNDSMAVNNI